MEQKKMSKGVWVCVRKRECKSEWNTNTIAFHWQNRSCLLFDCFGNKKENVKPKGQTARKLSKRKSGVNKAFRKQFEKKKLALQTFHQDSYWFINSLKTNLSPKVEKNRNNFFFLQLNIHKQKFPYKQQNKIIDAITFSNFCLLFRDA